MATTLGRSMALPSPTGVLKHRLYGVSIRAGVSAAAFLLQSERIDLQ